ncbi:MAG: cell filamentation protein Fic [Alphaproteobacteria bacterium RIFCSPLOWO2_01_FULL_40_26]|nr:MAG: cell filamentation protein Fic [Alphaproteobacteria bacterium RIFCSPHIGHO2_02_FULL_40_34]OFW94094.1 MAG: cell filamentation protein Fic [Alphaproteobacteria bacterium RIFCSPLOWO2_01_FULL_40_26]OFX10356.1 MAG: cell filamentation protein Fic [Alphaproteobacteria bacterium RIFCSPLOWO2_02_FULL_40_19]OFX11145.1 MAG: cell filamentation protein Fic [Alphaproteobacteria bacterium RIFCSPLOWO2_12_FULL_40_11]
MSITNFKSGNLVQRYQYKSFEPSKVNTEWLIDNAELQLLLSQADIKLGELNAFSQLIPDVDFFIKMHILKEGTKSSRIEGTQTNIDDAVQKEEYVEAEKKDDWLEVHNYVEAMNQSIKSLDKLPLSNRLLKQAHRTLMQDVRGNRKTPGEFRKSQNWIGGASLRDAVFIPPHQDSVDDLMADLEKFLHNENLAIPQLIKIGIAHYQFETIHPFLDGNGRIGRLLITLYLVSNDLLTKPTLYLSDFFEKHRSLYYDNLTRVRTHNDLVQWLKFFLEGMRATSENSIQTFKNIIKLRSEAETKIAKLGKKQEMARELLQHLYSNPMVDSSDVVKLFKINISTALRLIDDFVKLGILKETTGQKRNRNFVFEGYIKLFR